MVRVGAPATAGMGACALIDRPNSFLPSRDQTSERAAARPRRCLYVPRSDGTSADSRTTTTCARATERKRTRLRSNFNAAAGRAQPVTCSRRDHGGTARAGGRAGDVDVVVAAGAGSSIGRR